MNRIRWPLLIAIVCLPLAMLAAGYKLPWLNASDFAEAEPVPAGDCEIAWFNTTTSGATWERFVAGARKAEQLLVGLHVDDRRAFPQQTTEISEIVLSFEDRPAKLHIRWYKLSSDRKEDYWIAKLAERTPAPLAVIGGSSSDRARDMALALNRQTVWHGERPLLFLTNATAESVHLEEGDSPDRPLLEIYSGRTFRACYSNRQMAEALLDFVWQNPSLRPKWLDGDVQQALGSGLLAQSPHRPTVFRVAWEDDPFSSDLLDQFSDALPIIQQRYHDAAHPRVISLNLPFSVGGFELPNRQEKEAAASILHDLRPLTHERSLLVIPATVAPARRLLKLLCDADPTLGRRLVAINGDGIGANSVLRDGEYLWPIRSLPVPLVLFVHANPIAWDDTLRPPSSTDDVLQAAELIRLIAKAVYVPNPVDGANELAKRLQSLDPPFFERNGNRRGGSGEYILLLKPAFKPEAAAVEVWRRGRDRGWLRVE